MESDERALWACGVMLMGNLAAIRRGSVPSDQPRAGGRFTGKG